MPPIWQSKTLLGLRHLTPDGTCAVLRDRLAHVIEVSSTEAIYDISTTVNDDFSVANSAPARTSLASAYFLKASNVNLNCHTAFSDVASAWNCWKLAGSSAVESAGVTHAASIRMDSRIHKAVKWATTLPSSHTMSDLPADCSPPCQ